MLQENKNIVKDIVDINLTFFSLEFFFLSPLHFTDASLTIFVLFKIIIQAPALLIYFYLFFSHKQCHMRFITTKKLENLNCIPIHNFKLIL